VERELRGKFREGGGWTLVVFELAQDVALCRKNLEQHGQWAGEDKDSYQK